MKTWWSPIFNLLTLLLSKLVLHLIGHANVVSALFTTWLLACHGEGRSDIHGKRDEKERGKG